MAGQAEEKIRFLVQDAAGFSPGGSKTVRRGPAGPEPEVGRVYEGCVITGVHPFGCFVELMPGRCAPPPPTHTRHTPRRYARAGPGAGCAPCAAGCGEGVENAAGTGVKRWGRPACGALLGTKEVSDVQVYRKALSVHGHGAHPAGLVLEAAGGRAG